jgi:hypothetical protein
MGGWQSFFFVALRPDYGSRPPLTRFRYHTHWTHHTPQDSSGKVIIPTQRPRPDNTQQSQETSFGAPGGIRTRNPSRWAAADARHRPAATGIGNSRILIHNFCTRFVTACEWILRRKSLIWCKHIHFDTCANVHTVISIYLQETYMSFWLI